MRDLADSNSVESAEGPPDLRRKPRWELAGRWADLSEEVASALKRTEQAKEGSSATNQVCLGSRWRRWLVPLVVAAVAVAESVGHSASASWTVAGEAGVEQVAETESAESAGVVAAVVVAAEAAMSVVVVVVAAVAAV